jgi:hypothetical protein
MGFANGTKKSSGIFKGIFMVLLDFVLLSACLILFRTEKRRQETLIAFIVNAGKI